MAPTSPMLCMILLATLVPPATAAAASAEMFPGLRKRKLAVLQKQADKPHAPMPEDHKVKDGSAVPAEVPEEVPAVVDAAADGFPQLPGVSQMLSAASGTMKAVSSQASGLEARVVQAQMQIEAKMAKQKAAFEEKLKLQEQGNQKVIEANGNINAEIKRLQSGNAALRKHAHEIEQSNRLMRKELKALESHLAVAKDFSSKSLTATDDSKNALLQVLKKDSSHHALVEMASHSKRDDDDDDDDDEDSDDDEAGTSFLSLAMQVRKTSPDEFGFAAPEGPSLDASAGASPDAVGAPGDLLAVLAKDVANLAQHQKSSEKNLKNLFIRDFRAGIKRNKVLLAKQKSLISTRTSLLSMRSQLKNAEAHVDATRAQLEARLHGLGQYLQKLAHFAMAPQHEVPHLLQVLPKAVTVKAGKVA